MSSLRIEMRTCDEEISGYMNRESQTLLYYRPSHFFFFFCFFFPFCDNAWFLNSRHDGEREL